MKSVLIASMLAIDLGCGAVIAQTQQQPAEIQPGTDCSGGTTGRQHKFPRVP